MAAGSKIAVEIVGSSSELTAAAGKAAASLKDLGSVVTKESDAAVAAGGKSVRTNAQIAASYQETSRSVIAALQEQMAAVARASEELAAADGKQVVSARKALEAQTKAATATVRAQQQIMAANEKAAKSAQAAATQEAKASEEAAAASQRAASVHVSSAKRTEQAFGSASSGLTKAGKLITLGLVGAAAASVDLAVKFQANTLRMQTQAGATAKQLQLLRKGILDMAGSVGYTPNQLANALYHVVSSMNALLPASQRVSGELKVMRTAAQLAQVGHSDLEETTYALASAMNALHAPIADTTKLAGQMNAVVGSGDMTMTDLVETFKSGLLPGARQVGLSFQSVGAALAVMGDMGMRGALAGTRLRMSIALLSSPSEAAAKVLQTLGLSAREAMSTSQAMADALKKAGLRTTQLGADLRQPDGLMVALKDLNDHLRRSGLTASGAAAVMNKAFGGGRMGATITLLAQNTDRLNTKFHQIGDSANQFGADWQRQGQTTAQQLHNIEGGAIALGTRLGTDLLPMLETGIHDFTDFVKWVEHGGVVVHDLEIAIGTLATVAIGSYLVSNLMKAIKLFRELGQFVNNPLGVGQAIGRATAPTALGGAGAARPGLPGVGMISGARGFQAPGSVANPIVVAMEAGEFAGLSSMGAAGTVSNEMGAAKAETGALNASGGAVPVTGGAASAEKAAASGMRGFLNSALSGLMKGGLIAGGGMMASQMAGQAIGGKTGQTVAHVGTLAAVGGGVGALAAELIPGVGPLIGPLVGAISGGLIGGLTEVFKHHDWGQSVAAALSPDFGGANRASLQSTLASDLNAMAKLTEVAGKQMVGAGRGGAHQVDTVVHVDYSQLDPAHQAAYLGMAKKAGTAIAGQLEAGWSQYKFQSEPIMFTQMKSEVAKMPPAVQAYAIQSAVAFAQGLEKNKQMPRGAARTMLMEAEAEFPGFTKYLGMTANASVLQFGKALDLSHVQDQLKGQLDRMRGDFPEVVQAMDTTAGSINDKAASVVQALKGVAAYGTGPMKAQATKDLADLTAAITAQFTAAGQLVAAKSADMKSAVILGSQDAYTQGSQNWAKLAQSVGTAMSAGIVSTQQGTKLILDALNAALKALGEQPIGLATLQAATPAQLQAVASGQVTSGALAAGGGNPHGGHATGGLIQVGRPGERGHDRIPMNVGGVPIRVGLGEKVAVFNHQQQALAGRLIPGGLDGLFAATRGTRHDMAGGGIVTASQFGGPGDPGVGSHGYRGDDLYQHPDSFAELSMGTALGGLPYLAPVDVTLAGKTIRVLKRDIGAGGPGLGGHVRAIDLWFQAANALGLGGLANVMINGGGGVNVNIAGGGGGVAAQLAAPGVKGSGAIAAIARAGLHKVTAAANALLARQAPAADASVSVAPGGATSGPGGLATFEGVTMSKWIANELTWALAHGWRGQPTSGYRPGPDPHTASGTSEHALIAYPGGAVDFGGYTDPAAYATKLALVELAARLNYPGPRLQMPIGFHDDGHLSGTGHARGGFIAPTPPFSPLAGAQVTPFVREAFYKQVSDYWQLLGSRHHLPAHARFPHFTTSLNSNDMIAVTNGPIGGAPSSRSIYYGGGVMAAAQNAKDRNNSWARKAIIHEMAHTMQLPGLFGGPTWEVEGAAQAWTDQMEGMFGNFHDPGDTNYAGYVQQVRRAHPLSWILAGQFASPGGLIGAARGHAAGGYVDAARGLPPAKAPAKAKPKQKSVKQTKAAKLPKLPNLKALPGFDTTLLGQIAAGDTSAQELSNWLGYLQSLHGGVAAQATLTDSSGNTVVNWGSQAGAIGQLTGMVDPATGQVTKGIYDRLREIGDPGSAPNQTATRDKSTELGADEQILDTLLSEQTLAAQAAAELGPWVANMQSTVGFESEAAGWLQNALDPAFPWDTISLEDLGKILTGRVKQLKPGKKFPGGPAMAGASLGGMSELVLGSQQHFTIPLAQYVMDMARQYKNMIAQAQHWTKLKEQVPQEKADRDYTIAQRFAAARHRISNASATSTFDATTLLREQEAGLHQEERSALARISTAKPSGWVGDAATWRAERARERTGIGDEFAARKLALEDNAAAAKLTGQLAKSDALAALSSEERYERYAVATHFRAETTKLHDLISGDATVESQDKKYLGSVLSSIQAENTADVASLTAATGAGGFQDQLAAYLDPMGQLSLSVLTKENIDIAGLLREIAALKGTKVQAATPSAGNTTLDSLLAQQNTTLAETLALNEAQTRVLAGMIPEIPHFEKGGPMLDDGLAYLHKGEHVVPRGGTLVSQGAAAPVNITIEHHHHSPADALGRFVDTRVQSPHNVRAVSTQIGRRTSMLSNRPGSRRTDRI